MPAAIPLAAAAVTAGAQIYSSNKAAKSQKDAANAAARGADAATQEQARQFDTLLNLSAPQRTVGNSATNALARMLGLQQFNQQQYNTSQGLLPNGGAPSSLVGDTELPTTGRTFNPLGGGRYDVLYDGKSVGQLGPGGKNGRFMGNGQPIPALESPVQMSPTGMSDGVPMPIDGGQGDAMAAFLESPDYQFRRNEGLRDVAQSYAARGSGRSGNALRALAEFNSGLASGEFGNRFNRLAALAGFGQTANQNAGQAAIATGQGVSRSLIDSANARATGIAGAGAARADGIAGLAGTIPLFQDAYEQYQRNRLNAGYGGGAADTFNRSIAISNATRGD